MPPKFCYKQLSRHATDNYMKLRVKTGENSKVSALRLYTCDSLSDVVLGSQTQDDGMQSSATSLHNFRVLGLVFRVQGYLTLNPKP